MTIYYISTGIIPNQGIKHKSMPSSFYCIFLSMDLFIEELWIHDSASRLPHLSFSWPL